jgi:hypothetical protein
MRNILWRNKMPTGFTGKNLRKRGDSGTDGETMLNADLTKAGCKSVQLIYLAEKREKWPTPVNIVMNLWLPHNDGNFLTR